MKEDHIPKQDLVKGMYYKGRCRNATVARWDGTRFRYWRTKFNMTFLEYIYCPEDDNVFDVFYASEATDTDKEIPLES